MPRPIKSELNMFTVPLPDNLDQDLKDISKETKLAKSAIVNIATISLLERYKSMDSFVLADLKHVSFKDSKKAPVVNMNCSPYTKQGLADMSNEIGLSMRQLAFLATYNFVSKYKKEKTAIFFDILKPID